jgi:hypothetical protein
MIYSSLNLFHQIFYQYSACTPGAVLLHLLLQYLQSLAVVAGQDLLLLFMCL